MLHTKSQGHQPSGSGEEDFKGFLPYMGMSAILTKTICKILTNNFDYIRSLCMKFAFNWSIVSE